MEKKSSSSSSTSVTVSGNVTGGVIIAGDGNTVTIANQVDAEVVDKKLLAYTTNLIQDPVFSAWGEEHYFSLQVMPNQTMPSMDLLLVTRETGDTPVKEFQNTYTTEEAVAKFKQLVIIGQPGSGKTTTLRNLSLAYAEKYRANPKPGDDSCHLPVFIRLPGFDSVTGSIPYDRFLSLIRKAFMDLHVYLTEEELVETVRSRKLILFLDGLNEIVDPDNVKVFIAGLNDFVGTFSQHRVVITSRVYNFRLDKKRLPVLELLELKYPRDIKEYLSRYFVGGSEIKKIMDVFENNPRLRQIATNPLLLFLIILIFKNQHGVLPGNRSLLLEKIAYGLLGNWDTDSKQGGGFWVEDKHTLLRSLGRAMKSEGLELSKTRIVEIMKDCLNADLKHFSSENNKRPPYCNLVTRENIELLLDELKNDRILFETRDSGQMRFWHQTLQEYFAAVSIMDEILSHKGRGADSKINVSNLKKFIADESWHEIISLACGLILSSERLVIPNKNETFFGIIDLIWSTDKILASLCLGNIEDVQRQLPYIEKLKKIIFLWGISIPRAIPWILSLLFIAVIWIFPEPQTNMEFPFVFIPFISILLGLLASLVFFRVYVTAIGYYEIFSYQKFIRTNIIALRYLQNSAAELVLFEFNERTLHDFSISDYARSAMEAGRILLKRSEDELILMLRGKKDRLRAVEILAEVGGRDSARAMIAILEKEGAEMDVQMLESVVRSLTRILKRNDLNSDSGVLADILKSLLLDDRHEFARRLIAYRGLISIGVSDAQSPNGGSVAAVYLVRFALFVLTIAMVALLIILRG